MALITSGHGKLGAGGGEISVVLMDREPYSELPLEELAGCVISHCLLLMFHPGSYLSRCLSLLPVYRSAGLRPLRWHEFEGGCHGLYR